MTWAEVTQVCDMLQSRNVLKEIHRHLSVYNSQEIQHPDLPGRMMLRAHPFSQLPYHGKKQQDYAVWRPNCIETLLSEYNPSNPAHTKGFDLICVYWFSYRNQYKPVWVYISGVAP